MPGPDADLERELSDLGWLRRLARSLVRDDAAADDVVQETAVAALRAGPGRPRSLRAWLVTVARNAARRSHRDARRRTAREGAAARPEASPDASETAERLETARALLAAVDALEEPYRTAVRLRWLDGLPPREVAARLGVTPEVAWKRLSRGLATLRSRLDRDRGGRRGWVVAVADLGHLPEEDIPLTPLASAALVTAGSTWIAAATLLVAVCAIFALAWTALPEVAGSGADEPRADVPEPGGGASRAATARGDRRVARARVPQAEPAPAPSSAVAADPLNPGPPADSASRPPLPQDRVEGRVVDPDGAPVAGAAVALRSRGNLLGRIVQTGADGTFSLPHRADAATGTEVLVQTDAWAAAARKLPPLTPGVIDLGDVRVVRRTPISGRVTNSDGEPIAGARVILATAPPGGRVGLAAWTGPDGSFRLDEAGPGPWQISAQAPDDATRSDWVGPDVVCDVAGGDADVRLVARTRRPGRAKAVLDVVDAAGNPVRLTSADSVRAEVTSGASFETGRDMASVAVGGDGPNGAGTLTLDRVRAGDWTVVLRTRDQGVAVTPLRIGSADTLVRSRAVLRQPGGIRVRVRCEGSLPTGRTYVVAERRPACGPWINRSTPPDPCLGGVTRCSEDGTGALEGLAPGRYTLSLLARDWYGEAVDVDVPAGDVVEATIPARPGARIDWHPQVPEQSEAELAFATGDGEFRVSAEFPGPSGPNVGDFPCFPPGRLRWRIRVAPCGRLDSEGRRVATYTGEVTLSPGRRVELPSGPFEVPR
jgi:RNA polymerase sigma-70 factor (ECF subfamily)